MPAKPTAKPSLLEQAMTSTPTQAAWEETLTAEQHEEVADVLRAYKAGELRVSIPQLVKLFNDNGLGASVHRVRGAIERLKPAEG